MSKRKVVKDFINDRLVICGKCHYNINNICGLCGCDILEKTKDINEICPSNEPQWGIIRINLESSTHFKNNTKDYTAYYPETQIQEKENNQCASCAKKAKL